MKINSVLTLYLVSSLRMPQKHVKAANDVSRTKKGVCRKIKSYGKYHNSRQNTKNF